MADLTETEFSAKKIKKIEKRTIAAAEAGREKKAWKLLKPAVRVLAAQRDAAICARCWRDPDIDHERHEEEEKHVVTGRLAAPPDIAPAEFLNQIDAAISSMSACRIYIPDLCNAAGLEKRADVEMRRFEMLA